MSEWNYVVTAQKPTSVTHSCVGNFTSPQDLNLIVAKCTRIEIHLLTPQGLQTILDVPLYGRITTLELFRPKGETDMHRKVYVRQRKTKQQAQDTEHGQATEIEATESFATGSIVRAE